MVRTARRCSCLAALVVVLAAPLRGQDPVTPATGNLADLGVRLVSATKPHARATLIEVDVRNGGKATAEPAWFEVVPAKGAPAQRVERMPLPQAGRHGRGIAPAGNRRYWLLVASDAEAKGVSVRVEKATFHRAPPLEKPPVEVGALRHETIDHGGLKVDGAVVPLRNLAGAPLDLVFLASFTQPEKGRGLLTVRLQANEQRDWKIALRPDALRWDDGGGVHGTALQSLEPVDWSLVVGEAAANGDAAAGASASGGAPGAATGPTAPLWNAYERWVRWREPWPGAVTGRLVATFRDTAVGDGKAVTCRGDFHVKDVAPPILFVDGSMSGQQREAFDLAIDAAFADLRRPSLATVQSRAGEPKVVEANRFVVAPSAWPGLFAELIEVSSKGIAKVAPLSGSHRTWQEWTHEPVAGGSVVVAKTTTRKDLADKPVEVERWTYGSAGGRIVPLGYRRERRDGDRLFVVQFALGDFKVTERGARPPAGPPTGAGAEALRKAWENGYLWPAGPKALRWRFEARAGDDPVWAGASKFEGTLELKDFLGFRPGPKPWSAVVLDLAGVKPSVIEQNRLQALVEDRLLWLCERDFAGRKPFAETFAGARIDAGASGGTFAVQGGPITTVETKDGLVVRIVYAGGIERRVQWGVIGKFTVPVRVTYGGESVALKWKPLDVAWCVPIELRFEKLLGPDRGADTFTLADPALR